MKFNKKILICIFFLSLILVLPKNPQIETNEKSIVSPQSSGSISYLIIRPDSDVTNNGFSSFPASGYLFSKISDNVNYSANNGDGDYLIGDNNDYCELEMTDISLGLNQKVVKITLFARGQKAGTPGDGHYLDFEWRIGSGSYDEDRSLQYTSSTFSWLIASSWNGLALSQNDLNNLRLRIGMVGSYIDKFQYISVLYLNLTIETNHNPSVSLETPNGGETLQNSTIIEWTYSDVDGDSLHFNISYSIGFDPWKLIVSNLTDQDSYNWALGIFNSTMSNVRIRIDVSDGNGGFDFDMSDDYFTVRVNQNPYVNITNPNGGEIAVNSLFIEWNYYDDNADNLTFNLYYKISIGEWIPIVIGLLNVDSYDWDLTEFNETYSDVIVKINVSDGWGGNYEDLSDNNFTIRINHSPTINITYPVGGEVLQNRVIISWNYFEPDGDTMRFNLSYQVSGGNWIQIIQELVNTTSYEWDISSFTERLNNVNIKIEGIDAFGARIEIYCQNNFTIIPVEATPNPFNLFIEFLPFILIGSSIAIASISFSIYMRKSRKKKDILQKIAKINNKYIDQSNNGTKKVIIEADLLVKRGTKYNENDLLNLLFSDKEINNREEYESIKILGKLNITTLSEDFWEKIEKFKWEDDDKENFINDMLALPSNCREQFINEMLERFEVTE